MKDLLKIHSEKEILEAAKKLTLLKLSKDYNSEIDTICTTLDKIEAKLKAIPEIKKSLLKAKEVIKEDYSTVEDITTGAGALSYNLINMLHALESIENRYVHGIGSEADIACYDAIWGKKDD